MPVTIILNLGFELSKTLGLKLQCDYKTVIPHTRKVVQGCQLWHPKYYSDICFIYSLSYKLTVKEEFSKKWDTLLLIWFLRQVYMIFSLMTFIHNKRVLVDSTDNSSIAACSQNMILRIKIQDQNEINHKAAFLLNHQAGSLGQIKS